jgi:hypothetical protein
MTSVLQIRVSLLSDSLRIIDRKGVGPHHQYGFGQRLEFVT